MILEALKKLFEDESALNETAEDEGLGISAGVLMLEIARADNDIDDLEKEIIIEGIKNILHKTNHEINEIFQKVAAVLEESVSLFEFTSLINDSCSKKEKYNLLVILWKVAYADGHLDKYEEYYIRKIKDLLYLSQSDFIKAKLEAKP